MDTAANFTEREGLVRVNNFLASKDVTFVPEIEEDWIMHSSE